MPTIWGTVNGIHTGTSCVQVKTALSVSTIIHVHALVTPHTLIVRGIERIAFPASMKGSAWRSTIVMGTKVSSMPRRSPSDQTRGPASPKNHSGRYGLSIREESRRSLHHNRTTEERFHGGEDVRRTTVGKEKMKREKE
jgi:hypothetical protein